MNNEPSLLQKVYYFIKVKNQWTGIDELTYEKQFKDFDKNMLVNAAQKLMEYGALKPNEDITNVTLYTKMIATTDYYSLDDFLKNRKKAKMKMHTASTTGRMSRIELVSWIVGILGGLIAIYEFVLKQYLN